MSDDGDTRLGRASNDDLDKRRVEAARSQGLFREVNERIDELGERWISEETAQYVCECLDTGCSDVIVGLSRDEYRRIRLDPAEFVVLPGHELLGVEVIVDQTPRWVVVRKLGVGKDVAELLAGSHGRVG